MRSVIFALLALAPVSAKEPILKKGQKIAVVGDSITEQKLYSKYIELYLTACLPQLELRVVQLGWSGETAPGFAGRMNNDLLPFKPDVVTTCYGMNDGGYKAFAEATGKNYERAMGDIVGRLKKSGAVVVVGSPGAVDTKYFRGGGEPAKVYNATLGELRNIARKLAEANQMPFADVHEAMMTAMEKAKAALGAEYDVCGKDGVHPGPNGQLLMAYAFLKATGIDGQIGTITLDLNGSAAASEGHKVLSAKSGNAEIESERYPFCFSEPLRAILPFTSFNQDLNRLTLVVKNLDAARAKVTWGGASKSFSREDLEKGINLAEQFADNPFSDAFRKLDQTISAKQNFETSMIKSFINGFPRASTALGREVEASIEALRRQCLETHEKMGAAVRAARAPVKHALSVTAEK